MRTTKALLCAAVVAAGAVSAMAQSSNVYSLNVVGYVNSTYAPGKFYLTANPLDNGSNTLSSILPLGSGQVGTSVQAWNGTGFDVYTWSFGNVWKKGTITTNPVILPGSGFFVKLSGTATITNTYVGNIVANPGMSVTNPIPAGLICKASIVPWGGPINDAASLNFNCVKVGNTLQKWNVDLQKYDVYSFAFGNVWKSNTITVTPTLAVAESFFFNAGAATNWVQTFNPQ